MAGVGDAVDVTDFVAVVSGDGNFAHAIAAFEEFENDLSVKVPVAGELVEGNAAECADGIGAIAGMEFGEAGADEAILDEGQDFVAEELVERHVAAAGGAFDHHARAHDHLGLAGFERGEEVLHDLGGVLAVAVEEDDNVEASFHGVLIAPALVAAIHEIDGVLEYRKVSAGEFLLQHLADFVGVVLAGVVEDADFLDLTENGIGNAREDIAQSGLGVVRDDDDADAGVSHSGRPREL